MVGGAAGIGKTSVWRSAIEVVEANGARVVTTRASEVEMPIPLGHLADLIGDVLYVTTKSIWTVQGTPLPSCGQGGQLVHLRSS